MKVLILVAHGSRRAASNSEVERLCDSLHHSAGSSFDEIDAAFLEYATPSVAEAVDAAVARGADKITVLPYFLTAGSHVVRDVPAILQAKRREHPHMEFRLTEHRGCAPQRAELLMGLLRKTASGTF